MTEPTPAATVAQLRDCGLELTGDPPTATIGAAGTTATVTLSASALTVHLRAAVACAAAAASATELEAASASAVGDGTFAADGGWLVAERTLAAPELGALYDAVFELAKSAIGLGRMLDDMVAVRERLAAIQGQVAAVPATAPPAPAPPLPPSAGPPAGAPAPVVVAPPPAPAAPLPPPAAAPAPPSDPPPAPAAPAAAPVPAAPAAAEWVYVERSVPVRGARETDKVVGALEPGNWYRRQDEQRGWSYVVDHATGVQGWVDTSELRRRA